MHLFFAAWKFESLGDILGPAFVALFFFILPIVRAIKESKQKQREAEAKRDRLPSEETSEEDRAREMWEELVRGKTTAAQAEPPRASAPPPIPAATEGTFAPQQSVGAPLSTLSDARTESDMEARFDEEAVGRAENDNALREEFARRAQFLQSEREGAEKARTHVEPLVLASLDATPAEAARARVERERVRDPLGLGPNRRAGLRRAILSAEVLGRPVALRTGGEELGPLALRR